MAEKRCTVCGRAVDGFEGAKEENGRWFCSEGHFLEWSARPRRRIHARQAVALVVAACALLVLAWSLVDHHSTRAQTGRPGMLQSISNALKQAERAEKHPLVYSVTLTPQAAAVADAFVRDQYVTHDCDALVSLGHTLSGLNGTYGPISMEVCPQTLKDDRGDDAHLVRGSRVLERNCGGGNALFGGVPLKASECFQYATEGRYETNDDGSRDHECTGSTVDIFPKMFDGRWYVVAEGDVEAWGGGCTATDVSYWKRREPWTK